MLIRDAKGGMPVKFFKEENRKYMILTIICIITVISVWVMKYKTESNYLNSNANWHVLLTVQAYDETPASVHKFLPLVSLGDEFDKGIQWAEMVSDKEGNYYYTSFSAAGFVLPYFFFKLFHLPTNEHSLYIFSTVLCCLALLFTIKLFVDLFVKYLKKETIIVIATLLFAFQTEIMHGMGQVYWHQSLLQVLLPLQFLCFHHFHETKKWKIGFYILAFVMPYVEWTGFIANVGFALVLFLRHGIKIQKEDFMWAFWTGVCTAASLAVLCGHYLMIVDWNNFTGALRDRVAMRTTYAYATLFQLVWGYWKSFKVIWYMLPAFGLCAFALNKGFKWIKEWISMLPMLFVMAFPLIENLAMKEHAISYTYDRMKLIYPLMMVIFILIAAVPKEMVWYKNCVIVLMLVGSIWSVHSYTQNAEYRWDAPYRLDNEVLAEYCKENYHEESIYGLKGAAVRGYVNVLFDKSVYEHMSDEELVNIAKERAAKYAVMISVASVPDPANVWNMYGFSKVTVYDLENNTEIQLTVENGEVVLAK